MKPKSKYRLHCLAGGLWFVNLVDAAGKCLRTSMPRHCSGEAIRRAPR